MHFLGRLEILKQLAGYQLLGTNFSGLEIAPREVILKFVDFHWLHAVGNARLEWPYRKRALSLPQENGWHFAGLREQINNLARHFQRRTAFPASPACRLLTSPGAGGLLQPGENGKYLRGGGGGGATQGPPAATPPPPTARAPGPTAGARGPTAEARGGRGAQQRPGLRPPPPPQRHRLAGRAVGERALLAARRGEAATDPEQFLLRFLSPAERTVKTAPALWPGINLPQ